MNLIKVIKTYRLMKVLIVLFGTFLTKTELCLDRLTILSLNKYIILDLSIL